MLKSNVIFFKFLEFYCVNNLQIKTIYFVKQNIKMLVDYQNYFYIYNSLKFDLRKILSSFEEPPRL